MINCRCCKKLKSLDEFGNNKANKNGKSIYCLICTQIKSRNQYKRKGASSILNKSKYSTNSSEYRKDKLLRLRYGISLDEYNKILIDQNNNCAICQINKIDLTKILFVDHNHKTGQIRGLLCDSCNRGIGVFKESVKSLRLAADYLERFENN